MNEFDLLVGAQVHCHDGKCGKLAKFAVEPDARQVTHLIVEEGFLLKSARAFPFTVATLAATGDIYLAVGKDELANYPDYQENEVERPAPGYEQGGGVGLWSGAAPIEAAHMPVPMIRERVRQGVSPTVTVIEKGTPIGTFQGNVGKLDHVLVNPETGRITHLVMQQGLLFPEQRILPIAMVDHVGENRISVAATPDELNELRPYKPESEAVEEGAAPRNESRSNGQPEDNLGRRVAVALLDDSRTSDAVIEVIEDRGVVTLEGRVDSPEVRRAAENVAASQPGVIAVINSLEVVRR